MDVYHGRTENIPLSVVLRCAAWVVNGGKSLGRGFVAASPLFIVLIEETRQKYLCSLKAKAFI